MAQLSPETVLVTPAAPAGAGQPSPFTYRIMAPAGPGPHPTAVLLHGQGGSEDSMWVFAARLPRHWLVAAPRAPVALPDGGGHAWRRRLGNEWPELTDFDLTARELSGYLQHLEANHAADPANIVVVGFSQGAAAGFALAGRGQVRAVASLVGFLPRGTSADDQAWTFLAGVPVLALVGTRDPHIPLARSRLDADLMTRAGAQLDYREYHAGHKVTVEGMRELGEWSRGLDLSPATESVAPPA